MTSYNFAKSTGGGNSSRFSNFLIALCSLVLLCVGEAQAVQLTESAYSHSLTVKFPGYAGSATLANFPVLVRLPAGFDYASCQAGGADLRFAGADGELLDSEIDTWNPSGESLVWVRIPQLKQGTIITAHYGSENPDAMTPGNVWDSNYVSVYHLGGNSLPLAESTGRGKPFSSGTGTVGFNVPGAIGGAVDLTQSGAFCNLVCEDDDNLDRLEDLTIEVWTKQDSLDDANNRFLLSKRSTYNSDYSFALYQQSGKNGAFALCYTLDGTTVRWANSNRVTVEQGAWTHTVFTRVSAQSTLTSWQDAVVAWTATHASNYPAGELWNSSMGLRLGCDTDNVNKMFLGQVDEIRISKVVRSDLWIRTSSATAEPGFSEVCFDNDWSAYSHKINIKFSGYGGSTALMDFPVLVRLSKDLNEFDYDACQMPNGGDLRFADSQGNLLASEIDTWDTNGVSLVWVKVPTLYGSTIISAYYGCATPGPANPRDVWSNGYEGVWHLGDAGLVQRDSATNGLDFITTYDYAAKITRGVADGAVGRTVKFFAAEDESDKKGGFTASDPDGRLAGPAARTVELWTRQNHHEPPAGATWNGYYLDYKDAASQDVYLIYEVSGKSKNGAWANRITNGTDKAQVWFAVGDQYYSARNEWTHHAYRYWTEGGKLPWAAFMRGTKIGSNNGPAEEDGWQTATGSLCLGNATPSTVGVFPGNIDEVRISSVARSDDWIVASYDTIKSEQFASYELEASERENWSRYTRRFTVSFPDYDGGELTNFPVLVRVSTSAISGFSYADCLVPNGGDLRFADASGNLLASEVDTWVEDGTSLVWVKVPLLTSGTKIYGYYGCETPVATSARDVWSNGFIGVWHLNETGLVMSESTWKSDDFRCAAAHSNKVARGISGLVGGAVQFNNDGDKKGVLTAVNTDAYNSLPAITVETWLNFDEHRTDNNTYILCKWETWNSDISFCLYDNFKSSGTNNRTTFAISREGQPGLNNDDKNYAATATACETGSWRHQVFMYDSKTREWASYDNKAKSSGTAPYDDRVRTSAGPLLLGNGATSATQCFLGKIDEVRISNVARSQDWVNATYDTITDANFAHYSSVRDMTIKGFILIVR